MITLQGSLGGFGGDFVVPSYRGSSFLDPKVRACTSWWQLCVLACKRCLIYIFHEMLFCMQGRGGSTGYDNAVALPARSDSDELQKENNKSVAALKGQAVFSVAKVNVSIYLNIPAAMRNAYQQKQQMHVQ